MGEEERDEVEEHMKGNVEILDKHDYLNQLAPLDMTEDFSTASMLKNKGENLNLDKLAEMKPEQMIHQILVKAGIIDYERLVRLMQAACKQSK